MGSTWQPRRGGTHQGSNVSGVTLHHIDLHAREILSVTTFVLCSWTRNIYRSRMTRRVAHRSIRACRIIVIHSLLMCIKVFEFQIGCRLTIINISPTMAWGHTILIFDLLSDGSIDTPVCNLKTALTFWGFCQLNYDSGTTRIGVSLVVLPGPYLRS